MGGQGQSVLPQGMTKEQVQQMYQKYQAMKRQGVPDTDPEMMKARTILQQIQQRQELMKRQQAYRQMQMKQQQQQQQQQAAMHNGDMSANGAAASQAEPPASNGTRQTTTQTAQPAQTTAGPTQTDGSQDGFSKDQMMTLRAQMQAFGHLQKNMPIPQAIQERIFTQKQNPKAAVADAVAAAGKVLDRTATPAKPADGESDGYPRHRFETFTDPHSLLLKQISYTDHTQRAYRPFIPSIMPLG
ncbi:hypothetical protein KC343_g22982, partial [Hortaea werneckii]